MTVAKIAIFCSKRTRDCLAAGLLMGTLHELTALLQTSWTL